MTTAYCFDLDGTLTTIEILPAIAAELDIAQEIRRRESPDALVPIDRDPVPPQFADGVRRYYERLGGDK